MASHKKVSGIWLTAPAGVRFKKRPSAFNLCVGRKLKGKSGPTNGGRYDKGWQEEFTKAVHECS